ncbi:hypothetical protein BCR42DRAFT_350396 [Absidia repens]|uniref:Uncharacterized protein n=1 Tax=Absidia repens TaxID=90262 RepID=A0A1X2IK57_9FUNG|nr:hypothetical protein BCR42DRAFT_350396 [Absidia repens]
MSSLSNSRNYYNTPSKNTHSPAPSYESSRVHSESRHHSRLAAVDSSTLLASQNTHDYRRDDYHSDDPYAPRRPEQWHDPQDSSGPLLQDDTVMDMHDFNSPMNKEASAIGKNNNKNYGNDKKRICFGLGRKKVVAIGFAFLALVVLVWYFVWPRAFEMDITGTQVYGNTSYAFQSNDNGVATGFQAVWNVSMQADNKANWVPTHVQRLDLIIYDHNTGGKIANATTGSFVLGAKEKRPIFFAATIDFRERKPGDQTLQDLTQACAIAPASGSKVPQSSLNLLFELTYHISGLIWTYQTQQTDASFLCPMI